MLRRYTTLAGHLRQAYSSFPRSNTLNTSVTRARLAHQEPALHPDSHIPTSNVEKEEVNNMTWMTAFSPFNPGATRPLPLPWPLQSSVAINPRHLPSYYPPSSLAASKGFRDAYKALPNPKTPAHKPWPYTLPVFLQPKRGTTFHSATAASLAPASTSAPLAPLAKALRTGVLQALLYGVPEPEKYSFARESVAAGSLVGKVLHEVKDMDDEVERMAIATVEAVKNPDGEEIGTLEKEAESKIVVRDVEVKVRVEDVLEIEAKQEGHENVEG